ncbi:MAG: hypothetical protein ACYDCL_05425 [Myxococcales bacterium]
MAVRLALALLVAALPRFEQYTLESFPRALQAKLQGGALFRPPFEVRRLPAGHGARLWAVGEGCGEEGCRRTLLFLEKDKAFAKVGEANGDLADASGGEASPPDLTAVRRLPGGRLERVSLVWKEGAYQAGKAARLIVDPLSGDEVSREALDRAAQDDFVAGRDVSAAGRWAALCEAGCTPATRAEEGRASLRAGAFPQAEKALRAALKADPSLPSARLDLGDALAAQGKLGEAKAAYQAAARGHDEAIVAQAKDRLARLPR